MTFFISPIQAVTFRLCGECVLGVFLLPARLGHKCQNLLSPSDGNAGVNRLTPGLFSHLKGF